MYQSSCRHALSGKLVMPKPAVRVRDKPKAAPLRYCSEILAIVSRQKGYRILNMTQQLNDRADIDGLWTAEFGSSTGIFGGGAAVLKEGKIMGGDSTYYYTGEYSFSGNTFKATLKISPFIAGAESVFKTIGKDLTLDLTGSMSPDGRLLAQGHPEGMPHLNFGVKLTRRN